MKVSVTEAKGQLLDLVRRAEGGEEIVLTRRGEPVVRLTPIRPRATAEARHAALQAALGGLTPAADGDVGHGFLYGDDGLPS